MVTVKSLSRDLEGLWQKMDSILDSLSDEDWNKKFGPDWTVSDLPYHLSYFDSEIVASPIKQGSKVPKDKQRVFKNLKQLNEWNARMFKKRPKKQTYKESVKQMHKSREMIRKALSKLTDKDLKNPVFCFLTGMGWLDVQALLEGCIAHTWNHLEQLKIFIKRKEPQTSSNELKTALGFYMSFLGHVYNKEQAKKIKQFTAVMEFQGNPNMAWAFKIKNGECEIVYGKPKQADLIMSQSPETFVKTFAKIQNPMVAMLLGKIKVQGFRNMGKFGRIFAEPKLDQEIPHR